MILLIGGVLLWAGVHFIPSLAEPWNNAMRDRMGLNAYKGVFSVVVVLSIILMVLGWRAADQVGVYSPPAWGQPLGSLLVLIAFILFGMAHAKTNLKQIVRHPQLTGMVFWAVGHLLVNGDNLSLVLFGGLGLWALVEIPLINRREGAWQKPEKVPFSAEIRPLVTGLVIFAVFLFAHPYLFGVSPIPG